MWKHVTKIHDHVIALEGRRSKYRVNSDIISYLVNIVNCSDGDGV